MEPVNHTRADALRLLGWLKREKNLAPSLGGVFGSEWLGVAVQAFMDHLRSCGRSYATSAGYVKSFIAVTRFMRAARRGSAWSACVARGSSGRKHCARIAWLSDRDGALLRLGAARALCCGSPQAIDTRQLCACL